MDESCYKCERFSLCRLRDKACDLKAYFNKTGNFMGDKFAEDLYALMGSSCFEFKGSEATEGND